MVAQNHSHATKDLYDTIASGSFPEWRLYIQTMNPNDEDKYDFDPMDTTKIWPEELFPLQVRYDRLMDVCREYYACNLFLFLFL